MNVVPARRLDAAIPHPVRLEGDEAWIVTEAAAVPCQQVAT